MQVRGRPCALEREALLDEISSARRRRPASKPRPATPNLRQRRAYDVRQHARFHGLDAIAAHAGRPGTPNDFADTAAVAGALNDFEHHYNEVAKLFE